jgi:hypothetical protein
MRSASAASTLRDEEQVEGGGPMRRGSSQLLPHSATRPRLENAVMNDACSEAKRMSHEQTMGTAMPATGPLTAAMIGLRIDIRYV